MRLPSARIPPCILNLAVVLQVLLLCSSSAWLTTVITPVRSNARSLGGSWAGRGAAVEKTEAAPTSNTGTLGLASCRGRRVGIVGGGFAYAAKPNGTGAGDDDVNDGQVGRPGMQDRGGIRVRRRMDQSKGVPTDQQPFNELQELKEDPLFGWAQEDLKSLVIRLGAVYVAAMVVSVPIGTTTFPNQLFEALLAANVGALGVVLAVSIRLYSGWSYVSTRLDAEVVEYEESGWYDGSEWFKPPDVRARDEMLNIYEVKPAVDRLKVMLGGIAVCFFLTFAGFKVVVPEDPYAMLSDTYLNTLKNDDDIANEAARKAAAKGTNRPVYCESRYYQAVTGGGLCD